MFTAVSNSISIYTPIQRAAKSAMIQMAVAAADKKEEIAREDAVTNALIAERQKYLQTQYVGPARKAARLAALRPAPNSPTNLQAYYQDLRSGCHAGPKPASELAAADRYRRALGIVQVN